MNSDDTRSFNEEDVSFINCCLDITTILNSVLSLAEKMNAVTFILGRDLSVNKISIISLINDNNSNKNNYSVFSSTNKSITGFTGKVDNSKIVSWVIEKRKNLLVDDINKDERFKQKKEDDRQYSSNSFISIPMFYDDNVIAILTATDKDNGEDLNSDDLNKFKVISEVIAPQIAYTLLKNEIKSKNDQLAKAQDEREKIIRMIMHDIKTPLNALSMGLDITLRKVPDKLKEDIEELFEPLELIDILLVDISCLIKSRVSSIAIVKKPFDMEELISKCFRVLKLNALDFGIEFVSELKELIEVTADFDILKRILINLMTNALDYAPDDSKVIVSARKEDEKIIVSVSDKGIGIPKDKRSFVFGQFAQVTEHPKRNMRKGTGIGLNFCKIAINKHGGDIWVEDTDAPGATISFSFPVS